MKNIFLSAGLLLAIGSSCSHRITGNTTSVANVPPAGTIRLQKGQHFIVDNQLVTASTSELQGQSMETNARVTTRYDLAVNDATGDRYKMTNRITSIKMTMSAMGQDMNFDSGNKDDMNGQIGSSVKPFIDTPQVVNMDNRGNLIMDSTASADSASQKSVDPATAMLRQLGDPATQGYGAKFAFLYFPKGIAAGTSWQDSVTSGGTTTVTHFSIQGLQGDTATVATSGTDRRETKTAMQGMEIQTKTSGSFSGVQSVNIRTGVIGKSTSTLTEKGTISVMGQEIPTTVTVTTTNIITPQ